VQAKASMPASSEYFIKDESELLYDNTVIQVVRPTKLGVRSIAISVFVCVSVCLRLSVRSCVSKTICPNFTNSSLHQRYLCPWLGPLTAIHCSLPVLWMTSHFHIMESNRPESNTTRMIRPVRQVATPTASCFRIASCWSFPHLHATLLTFSKIKTLLK